MLLLITFVLAVLRFSYVTSAPQAVLTTANFPVLEGPTCPRTVNLTCMGQDIPFLRWAFDGTEIALYFYTSGDESIVPVQVDSSVDLVSIQIVSVETSSTADGINTTSLLSTSISVLADFSTIQCGTNAVRSNVIIVDVSVLGTAPSPFSTADCSLVSFSGNSLNVSLRWSPSFNSQYNVEQYRVTVTPDPSPSCSGLVLPSKDYSCSRLDPETDYSITVSAINCGDQEGQNASFIVQPQLLAPKPPQAIEVMPNSIEWMQSLTVSGKCSFTGAINYVLILEDSTGRTEERNVSSDSCDNGSCSTDISTLSQICSASIVASNAFGSCNSTSISIIDPPRLTSTNQVLLGLGVVLLCVAIAGASVVFIVMVKVKNIRVSKLSVILLVCGAVLMLVSAVLWVTVGVLVGQDNTCDSDWQTSRDGLIISSFLFSMMSLILVAAVFVVSVKNRNKRGMDTRIDVRGRSGAPEELVEEHKDKTETPGIALNRIGERKIKDDPVQYDVTHKPAVKVPPQDSTYSSLNEKKGIYATLQHFFTKKPGVTEARKVTETGEHYSKLKPEKSPPPQAMPNSTAPLLDNAEAKNTQQHPHEQPTNGNPKITQPPHGNEQPRPTGAQLSANQPPAKPVTPPPKPPREKSTNNPFDADLSADTERPNNPEDSTHRPLHQQSVQPVQTRIEDISRELGHENILLKDTPTSIDKEGGKMSKPVKQTEAGGRALEIGNDFRKPGEEYGDANCRVREEKYQQHVKREEAELYSKTEFNIPKQHGQAPPPTQDPSYSHLPVEDAGASGEVRGEVHDGLDRGKQKGGKGGGFTNPVLNGNKDTLEQPPCITMWKLNTYLAKKRKNPNLTPQQAQDIDLQQSLVAEWFPDQRKWPKEDLSEGRPLKVYFMNDCPMKWKYNSEKITPDLMMAFLSNTWENCFTIGHHDDSPIRVTFQDQRKNNGNWSAVGSMARNIQKSKPTILLDFSNMSGEDIKATVVHQFGHALGLGHALMKPDDWEVLKGYLDLNKMISFYFSPSMEEFEVQWTGKGNEAAVNYDGGSIMRYSTNVLWLNDGALRTSPGVDSAEIAVQKSLKKFIKHARLKGELSADDRKVLRTIHGVVTFGWEEVLCLKNEKMQKTFNLADKIASSWRRIGRNLGIEEEDMDNVVKSVFKGDDRIKYVLSTWFNKADSLPNMDLYPLSWEGLRKLLVDGGLQKTSQEYFTFLDGLKAE